MDRKWIIMNFNNFNILLAILKAVFCFLIGYSFALLDEPFKNENKLCISYIILIILIFILVLSY